MVGSDDHCMIVFFYGVQFAFGIGVDLVVLVCVGGVLPPVCY